MTSALNSILVWVLAGFIVSGIMLGLWIMFFGSLAIGVQRKLLRHYFYGLTAAGFLLITFNLLMEYFGKWNVVAPHFSFLFAIFFLIVIVQMPICFVAGIVMLVRRWDIRLGALCIANAICLAFSIKLVSFE